MSHCKLLKLAEIHIKFDPKNFDENVHKYGIILFTSVSIQKCLYAGNTARETLAYSDLIYQLKYCGGICGFNGYLPSSTPE